MPEPSSAVPDIFEGYDTFLYDLKARIQSAQIRAALSVNREMILLYWQIGNAILERQLSATARTGFGP
jgi:hypothetical protein